MITDTMFIYAYSHNLYHCHINRNQGIFTCNSNHLIALCYVTKEICFCFNARFCTRDVLFESQAYAMHCNIEMNAFSKENLILQITLNV